MKLNVDRTLESEEELASAVAPRNLISTSIRPIHSKTEDVNKMMEKVIEPTVSQDLKAKLAGDVLVACGVTLGVAPFLSVIDKAIVQSAAGTHTLSQSTVQTLHAMTKQPASFLKSPMFLMMWGVYAATYTTANCLKTYDEHQRLFGNKQENHLPSRNKNTYFNYQPNNGASPQSHTNNNESDHSHGDGQDRNGGIGKSSMFLITTAVNSSATMVKDKFYATIFNTSKSVSSPSTSAASSKKTITNNRIPFRTYGLWGLRDCMVIGSSFILPDIMCDIVQNHTELDRSAALRISQFTCPILTQLIAGPVQLLGLDFYNRSLARSSYKKAILERLKFQRSNFASIVTARIARIAPAYGIGGIGNTFFRDEWREMLLSSSLSLSDIDVDTFSNTGTSINNSDCTANGNGGTILGTSARYCKLLPYNIYLRCK